MPEISSPITLLEKWVAAGRPGSRQYRIEVWGQDRLVTLLAKVSDVEVVDTTRLDPDVLRAARLALTAMRDLDYLSALPVVKGTPGRKPQNKEKPCPSTGSKRSKST